MGQKWKTRCLCIGKIFIKKKKKYNSDKKNSMICSICINKLKANSRETEMKYKIVSEKYSWQKSKTDNDYHAEQKSDFTLIWKT